MAFPTDELAVGFEVSSGVHVPTVGSVREHAEPETTTLTLEGPLA